MGFFDNDPFEDIIKEFFSGRSGSNVSSRTFRNNIEESSNFVQSDKNVYFVLDLSGKQSVNVEVKDELVRNEYGEQVHTGKKALVIKSSEGDVLQYALPKKIKSKNFHWNFKNGILEVKFKK